MATRMQQRKGTAQQWLSTNSGNGPVLNPGEIGFEIDTNKFKIGDGVSHWADLNYFADVVATGGSIDDYVPLTQKGANNGVAELDNTGKIPASQIPALVGLDTEIADAVSTAVSNLIDSAPAALNTLNELAAALGDDANFSSTVTTSLGTKQDKVTDVSDTEIGYLNGVTGAIQTQLNSKVNSSDLTEAAQDAINIALVPGTGITKAYDDELNTITIGLNDTIATKSDLTNDITTHNQDTTLVHGIADTSELVTINDTQTIANKIFNNPEINVSTTGAVVDANISYSIVNGTLFGAYSIPGLSGATHIVITDAEEPLYNGTYEIQSYAAGDITLVSPGFSDAFAITGNSPQPVMTMSTATGSSTKSITSTELGYLDGVTANIQNQIASRVESSDFSFLARDIISSSVGSGLFYDGNSNSLSVDATAIQVRVPDVSDIAIGYLSGVTSAIQDQLDDKASSANPTFTTGNAGTRYVPDYSGPQGAMSAEIALIYGLSGNYAGYNTYNVANKPSGWDDIPNNMSSYVGKVMVISGGEYAAYQGEWPILEAGIGPQNQGFPVVFGLGNSFPGQSTSNNGATVYIKSASTLKTISDTELGYLDGVTSGIQAQIDTKASLASPALTGSPTAPTAIAGTNTTQVATTEFVGTAVSNLVASAPGTLDTLNELATALGNDASFSTTVTNSIALKAPLADPTFTGTVTIPAGASISGFATLADPTFTGTVAGVTKAHVGLGNVDNTSDANKPVSTATQTALNAKSNSIVAIYPVTSNYTARLEDADTMVEMNVGSANTITIPANSSVAIPVGTRLHVVQIGSGQTTITPAGGVTINGTPGLKTRAQYSAVTLVKRATDTWIAFGDLTA